MNVFSLLDLGARRFPDEPAIYLGDTPFCTWQGLRNRALSLAGGLQARLPSGARVAIASSNVSNYVEIMFGTWAAGLILVPVNAKLHPRETCEIIVNSGADVVFASAALATPLKEAGCAAAVVVIGGDGYDELLSGEPIEPEDVESDDTAWLFYTSGTTGRSKGAMLSHRNLITMALSHLADFEDLGHGDAIIHAAPMSHGSGLYVLPYVARAAKQVVPASGGFDPDEFIHLCGRHPGSGAFLAPTMVQKLRNAVARSGSPPAGLRSLIYGGGPMYLEEIKKSLEVFGPVFCQLYGQGEAPMTITGLRRSDFDGADDEVLSSVGWPRSGVEVAILDDEGRRRPAGEIGEIACRGDIVMKGYWQDPAATRATIRDGWLYTGDMGTMDERGKVTLRDRSKDVIISGGSNIYPREVEEVLISCPGVMEVSVVGQRDEEWGEIVIAFIVGDETCPDAEALDRHCLSRISRFKRPKRYVFVESLPKNSYGKVLKRQLAQRLPSKA